MEILTDIPTKRFFKDSAITIGSFDGMHLGHSKLFSALESQKKDLLKTVVVTFYPNPKSIILGNDFQGHISSKTENIDFMKKFNIDLLCILKFNSRLKEMSANNFLNKVIKAFNPQLFIVGYNHYFGNNREGDLAFLQKKADMLSFNVKEISEYSHPIEGKVSSSIIRKLILNGEVAKASNILGYNYRLQGKVAKGQGIGRKIGFPTANISLSENLKILPKIGVYFIQSEIDGEVFYGMCNIGVRPTVSSLNEVSIEVYFFNLNFSLYNKILNIDFIKFLRDEKQFDNLESLKKQLELDKNKCLEYSINNV